MKYVFIQKKGRKYLAFFDYPFNKEFLAESTNLWNLIVKILSDYPEWELLFQFEVIL